MSIRRAKGQQMVVNHAGGGGDLKAWRGEVRDRERKGQFRQGEGGEYTRSCIEVYSAVVIFSSGTWNV